MNNTSVSIDQFECKRFELSDFRILSPKVKVRIKEAVDAADGLTGNAKRVWLLLSGLVNRLKRHAFPSHGYLARKLNLSVKTIQRALKALADRGWLFYAPGAGERENIMLILCPESLACVLAKAPSPAQGPPPEKPPKSEQTDQLTESECPVAYRNPIYPSTSSMDQLREALAGYGVLDDATIKTILKKGRQAKPGFSDGVIIEAAIDIAEKTGWRNLTGYLISSIRDWLEYPERRKYFQRKSKTATVFRDRDHTVRSEAASYTDKVIDHLKTIAVTLEQRPEPSIRKIASELQSMASEEAPNLEELQQRLQTMEGQMVEVARASLPSKAEALRHTSEDELRLFRDTMSPEQITLLEDRYLHVALLEAAQLPQLNLVNLSV